MSDVQFNEPNYGIQDNRRPDSALTKAALKLGVKREKIPATLLVVAVLAVVVMLFVGFGSSASTVSNEPTPDELIGS